MSILANEFFVAAGNAAKKNRTVIVKKGDSVDKLMSALHLPTKDELRKELHSAEKIYNKLEGKLTKKKLKSIAHRIEKLKEKLDEPEEETEEIFEHDGKVISAPVFGEIEKDLDDLDESFGFDKSAHKPINNDEEFPDIQLPNFVKKVDEPIIEDEFHPRTSFHILNIPPPPPKNELS